MQDQGIRFSVAENGTYEQVTVDCKDAIHLDRLLHILLGDFKKETGKAPKGFILGPKEYVQLAFLLSQKQYGHNPPGIIWPTQYIGFPITLKEMPGIDLEIDHDYALVALHKLYRKKT